MQLTVGRARSYSLSLKIVGVRARRARWNVVARVLEVLESRDSSQQVCDTLALTPQSGAGEDRRDVSTRQKFCM